jgi:predicted Zn-dependent protease
MNTVVTILDAGEDKNKLFSAINELTALYVGSNRKIDALQLVQKYADKYPDNQMAIYQLAELQVSVGQYDQANKNLDRLIKLSPDSIDAYYLKGIIARRQKQIMNTEKWFSKVNKMEPKNEQAWIQRAGSYADAGNLKHAISILADAVKQNETSGTLWFEYGALLTDAGDHEEAAKAYKTVLNYYPRHLPSIDNLAGSLLILENNPPEALFFAQSAYSMEPDDTVLQLNYLEALLLNKKYKELLDLARKLQPNLKSYPRFQYVVGAAQYHTGNKNKGVKNLNLAKNDTTLEKRYKTKIDSLLKAN